MTAHPANTLHRALAKIAAAQPAWGTPEHDEWLRQIGRNAFVQGHMGAGGPDLDKQDAIDANEDYDVFPKQNGGGR